jgi:hypothetical protein
MTSSEIVCSKVVFATAIDNAVQYVVEDLFSKAEKELCDAIAILQRLQRPTDHA